MQDIVKLYQDLVTVESELNDPKWLTQPSASRILGIVKEWDWDGMLVHGVGMQNEGRAPDDIDELVAELAEFSNAYRKEWNEFHTKWNDLNAQKKELRNNILSTLRQFGQNRCNLFIPRIATSCIPTEPGVYILLSPEAIEYVGQTGDFRQRLQSHNIFNPIRHGLGLIACENERFGLEIDLIRRFRPRKNRQYILTQETRDFLKQQGRARIEECNSIIGAS